MDQVIFALKGVGGQLEVYADKVVIGRKGALAKMSQGFFKGEKTILIRQITAIQVKLGGALTNGYVQFSLAGGIESTKGIMAATQDENTVMFAKKNNELVSKIKEHIERVIREGGQPGTRGTSDADEIRKFKQLLDEGVISQEEFTKKKSEILGT